MNMKSKAGFTLVELIVVIAILAILAGVAIPAYSGYITKAKDAAVISELDAIVTAAQGANASKGAIDSITVTATQITVTAAAAGFATDFDADFVAFYGGEDAAANTTGVINKATDLTGSSYASGATWYRAGSTIPTGKVAGWNK